MEKIQLSLLLKVIYSFSEEMSNKLKLIACFINNDEIIKRKMEISIQKRIEVNEIERKLKTIKDFSFMYLTMREKIITKNMIISAMSKLESMQEIIPVMRNSEFEEESYSPLNEELGLIRIELRDLLNLLNENIKEKNN